VRAPFVLGLAATAIVLSTAPSLVLWTLPVVAGPLVAPLLVWALDRADIGRTLRDDGLLTIPAECVPPPVTLRHRDWHRRLVPKPTEQIFVATVLEHERRGHHLALLQAEPPSDPAPELALLKALRVGPSALDDTEIKAVLEDADAFRTVAAKARADWPATSRRPVPADLSPEPSA
jgi:membrane glycosyltransferase